jgi:hypothetical protein
MVVSTPGRRQQDPSRIGTRCVTRVEMRRILVAGLLTKPPMGTDPDRAVKFRRLRTAPNTGVTFYVAGG